MKRILALAFAILMLAGCKKDENNNNNPNPCSTPSLGISPITGGVQLGVYGSADHGFWEIEYGANGFAKGSGTKATISSDYQLTNLTNGTYDIYVRGNCGGTSFSDWSNPQSFLVQDGNSSTCPAPGNLGPAAFSLNEDIPITWNDVSNAGYYEIEYGPTGFTRGTGTKRTVNHSRYSEGSFNKGTTYDVYVRSNCGGGDFSPWTGPYSFYADHNAHTCQPPTNLAAYYNGLVQFSFNRNGENEHEVYLNTVPNTTTGDLFATSNSSGEFTGSYSNVKYYVYVRSICLDGSRTAWTGPVVVN